MSLPLRYSLSPPLLPWNSLDHTRCRTHAAARTSTLVARGSTPAAGGSTPAASTHGAAGEWVAACERSPAQPSQQLMSCRGDAGNLTRPPASSRPAELQNERAERRGGRAHAEAGGPSRVIETARFLRTVPRCKSRHHFFTRNGFLYFYSFSSLIRPPYQYFA